MLCDNISMAIVYQKLNRRNTLPSVGRDCDGIPMNVSNEKYITKSLFVASLWLKKKFP